MANETKVETEFDFAVFWEKHRRNVSIAVVAVVVVGAVGWFWRASNNLKESRAETAYANAERTFYSGNMQLASSELNRLIMRYGGTHAAVRASMLLAKSHYSLGTHGDGVAQLQRIVGSRAAKPQRAAIHALIAAGLENQGKFDEAASAYQEAASSAGTRIDQDIFKADQARALMSAGKRTEALAIWQALAERDASPLANEARLRVGELSAAPAGRS